MLCDDGGSVRPAERPKHFSVTVIGATARLSRVGQQRYLDGFREAGQGTEGVLHR